MKKRLFLALCTSLFILTAVGQDFRGVIVNAKQRPLKGMKVWKKNTTESVKTDEMGVFSFSGLKPTDTLVVSISKKEEAVIPIGKMSQASLKIEKKFFILFDGQKDEKREYTKKNAGHTQFTEEQMEWLRLIKDHIISSLSILDEDLDYTPFDHKGGLLGFYEAFGDNYKNILNELNAALVA